MVTEVIDGIVIYCSDPRTEKANLWKDIKHYLIPHNQRWAPIALLGGPISLAHPTWLPIDFAFLIGQIEFALSQFKTAQKFIAVGHDCGYYGRMPHRKFTLDDKKQDIHTIAEFLQERFKMAVRGHFKKPDRGFETIISI